MRSDGNILPAGVPEGRRRFCANYRRAYVRTREYAGLPEGGKRFVDNYRRAYVSDMCGYELHFIGGRG